MNTTPKPGTNPEAILFVPAGHGGYSNQSCIFARMNRRWFCVKLDGCKIAETLYPANDYEMRNTVGELLTFNP